MPALAHEVPCPKCNFKLAWSHTLEGWLKCYACGWEWDVRDIRDLFEVPPAPVEYDDEVEP